ncbi:DUF300-domain-containing protein [Pholiota conissans]|uniref:DUF300-domain-containing protein n=1 Tax=Pholiota conissans TaxID=109636 RepID=A0A9P6CY70_9AGAR|nr:DUF300-domain-containing protein [Pholiota conissans]
MISGAFTLVAVAVSLWLISRHLQWYTNKREQRYIVRLLFMVPLYAVISFTSFLFWNHSTPIILIRDAYEAIVLTAFFYLLLMYLSHDTEEQKRIFLKSGLSVEADKVARKKGQDPAKWVFPLGFIRWKPWDGLYFLQLMKWGVLQYCVVRPTSTLAAVILNYMGLYCEDSWGVGWGHIYITIVTSVSVTVAMYCLLQLYVPVAKDLSHHQPLLKLFSVKAVVFLTFWQATLLSLLSMFGFIKDTKYMTADDINNAIGAVLETFEMMLFAFLHIRAFTYKPYSEHSNENTYPCQTPQWRSLGHAMDFRETFREIWVGCIYMFDSMRGKEATPDFGVIREVHYNSAFGRRRLTQATIQQPRILDPPVGAADLTLPPIRIAVDQEVEVVINGKREWLLLEKLEKREIPIGERDEGLQEQIDRELASRGYARPDETSIYRDDFTNRTDGQGAKQRSWWRRVYDRISQTEREHEEDEQEPLQQTHRMRSRFRSQRHRSSTQCMDDTDHRDIDDQPSQGILYPSKQRPSQMPLRDHGIEPDAPRDDRDPLSGNDLRTTPRYEDQPPPLHTAHGGKRKLRPSRSGACVPSGSRLAAITLTDAGGADCAESFPIVTQNIMPAITLPTTQSALLLQSSAQSPVPQAPANKIWSGDTRDYGDNTNFTLSWSPSVPPKDSRENHSKIGAALGPHRKSAHRREAASTLQGDDRRINARVNSVMGLNDPDRTVYYYQSPKNTLQTIGHDFS